MVNKSTLRLLNDIAFGADIDSLESYLINFKQASMLCDLHRDTKRYNILYNILRDMKGNSLLFSDRTNLRSVDKDDNDILFKKYPNNFINTAYGLDDTELDDFRHTIKYNFSNSVGVVAIANVCGLHLKCLYVNGYLRNAYIIGEAEKYLDITDTASEIIPEYVSEFKHYDMVELRGKITTSKVDKLIPECSTLHFIKNNYNINTLQVFIEDIILNEDELPYENYWGKLDYIEEIGFNVPTRALILDIDISTLDKAILEMDNYIYDNLVNPHNYFGIQLVINNDVGYKNTKNSIIYVSRSCNQSSHFISKLKSIKYNVTNDIILVTLGIIPTHCNDKVIIDTVIVNDVYNIELLQLAIGKEIRFHILNDKAYLLDK